MYKGDFKFNFVKYDDASLFETIRKARDAYRNDLKIASDTYKDAVAKAKKTYLPAAVGSAIEEAKNGFDQEKNRLEFRFLSTCDEVIRGAEKTVTSRLRNRDADKINEVRMLRGMKITPREFAVIADRQSLTLDYFASKELRELAEQNGICVEDLPESIKILPAFDEQMDCLEELKQECEDFVTDFNPDIESPKDLMYLSDKKITSWENRFTNGLRSASQLSDDAKIRRSMTAIEGAGNEATKGKAIKEALSSVDDGLRARLLFEIADSRIISDTAVKMSGSADEITAFRNGGTAEFKDAQGAVKKIAEVKDIGDEKALETIHSMRGNRYFNTELRKVANTDTMRHYAELAEEQAAEGAEH